MGPFALLALLSALLGWTMFGSDDDNDTPDDNTPDDNTPDDEPSPPDTGATFLETADGVELDIGDDETGRLAVIYYTDTEDTGSPPILLEIDQARFYLVPEGVDWSGVNWETQSDIPGADDSPSGTSMELQDFEEANGLELLGVVDLLGVPTDSEDPADRIGEITANAPVDGYFLQANTDGDDLISFLPEDFVVTRNGVPETSVSEDTIGTDGIDWLSTEVGGITLDGAGGDDVLFTTDDDVTLLGGAGDDTIESFGAVATVIDAGEGDDSIRADDATVDLGAGDDYATIDRGTVHGGDGADEMYGNAYIGGEVSLFGDAGDDLLVASGENGTARGGAGDDTVGAFSGSVAYGDAGDDQIQIDPGSQGYGGDGNDLLSVYNGVADGDGPATLTGGQGQDTIDAQILNFRGVDEGVFAIVTDFDITEDVLVVGDQGPPFGQNGADLQNVTIIEAPDGSYTDVELEFTWPVNDAPGNAVIRLEGTTGLTLSQIVIGS